MNPDKDILYEEALKYFNEECLEVSQIKEMFSKAIEEIKSILNKINQIDSSAKFRWFGFGVLKKYLFSCVIDADRYDTYTFMEGKESKPNIDKLALWNELSDVLETKLESYPKETKIDLLRAEISLACKNFAVNSPGIYQLSVPTGGGKTLSSLRYALEHAKKFDKDRIFCIIPFTTIIDQNAKEIKDILGHEDMILEHHSNLILDYSQDNDEELEDYKLLTGRWDSPIILTTMVQFLNTLFSGGTQDARRIHNLANIELTKEKQYIIFHLSTSMCSSHRMSVLQKMREKLGHERVICISTQLIEAGVNISFGCVVRSLAGLDNIAQAAGRCNRHGETECSDVYIVNVEGENVNDKGFLSKGVKMGASDQSDAFIRFRVENGDLDSAIWLDKQVYESHINYYLSIQQEVDLCYVKGQAIPCSDKHPAKVRNTGDKSKLISANDTEGFTYRGRFVDKTQVVRVGYETTQKAHNALRWLIDKQGYKNGDQVVIA